MGVTPVTKPITDLIINQPNQIKAMKKLVA